MAGRATISLGVGEGSPVLGAADVYPEGRSGEPGGFSARVTAALGRWGDLRDCVGLACENLILIEASGSTTAPMAAGAERCRLSDLMVADVVSAMVALKERAWGFAVTTFADLAVLGGMATFVFTGAWDGACVSAGLISWTEGLGISAIFTGRLGSALSPAATAVSGLFPVISQISAPRVVSTAAIRPQGKTSPKHFIAAPLRTRLTLCAATA
jgi:hypothetical protein